MISSDTRGSNACNNWKQTVGVGAMQPEIALRTSLSTVSTVEV